MLLMLMLMLVLLLVLVLVGDTVAGRVICDRHEFFLFFWGGEVGGSLNIFIFIYLTQKPSSHPKALINYLYFVSKK